MRNDKIYLCPMYVSYKTNLTLLQFSGQITYFDDDKTIKNDREFMKKKRTKHKSQTANQANNKQIAAKVK